MNQTHSAELYRQGGPEKRLVTLSVGPDGVELGALDAGPLVQQTWGRDYYEFWVDVPADEIHNLLFALLRERYAGRNDAVDEFRTFCEKEGINTSGAAGHSGTDIHTDSASAPTTIRAGFLAAFQDPAATAQVFYSRRAGTRTRRGLARVSLELLQEIGAITTIMAATNKYLAQGNKSSQGTKRPTSVIRDQPRSSLMCPMKPTVKSGSPNHKLRL